MLPYHNRLIKRKDFERVGKFGRFFSRGDIVIKILENGLSQTRIGVVAGLKFSKKAIERNQAKRRLREIFYARLRDIPPGLDIIIMVKKKGNASYKDLARSAEQLLQECRLIHRPRIIDKSGAGHIKNL